MPRIRKAGENGQLSFFCKACDVHHLIRHGGETQPQWLFNGDYEKPVISPSVLVTYDHLSEAARERNRQFHKNYGRYMTHEELPYDVKHICHSFIGINGALPGQIMYLPDCTHQYAGQTIDLPEVNEE